MKDSIENLRLRCRFDAGALYLAIVSSLIIGILSAAMILVASYYRNNYLKVARYQLLRVNLESATRLGLAAELPLDTMVKYDLYGDGADSVSISRCTWGAFDCYTICSFKGVDTLKRAFWSGHRPDSVAFYLSDEDRPVSISGASRIVGDALLPKSGIRKSYADGKPYSGEQLVYQGSVSNSGRSLPVLESEKLDGIKRWMELDAGDAEIWKGGAVLNSFFSKTRVYRLETPYRLSGQRFLDHVVMVSDSLIEVDSGMELRNVILVAPVIRFGEHFKGSIQAFASDSMLVGNGCSFAFPSVLGLVRRKRSPDQPRLRLGDQVSIAGWLMAQQESGSKLNNIIELGKDVKVEGGVYCNGILKLEKGTVIKGKVLANRLLMRTPATLYENFLIDVRFSALDRHRAFLNPALLGNDGAREVVQWLD